MLDICCKKRHNNNILESNKLITHCRGIITCYNYCVSWGACKRFDLVDIILMTRTSFGSNNRAHHSRLMYDLFMATSWHSILGSCAACEIHFIIYYVSKISHKFHCSWCGEDNHMIVNVHMNIHFLFLASFWN